MITYKRKKKIIEDFCDRRGTFSYHCHGGSDYLNPKVEYMYPNCRDKGCPIGNYCTVDMEENIHFPIITLPLSDGLQVNQMYNKIMKFKEEEERKKNMREYICEDSEKEEISITDKSGGVAHQDEDSEKRNTMYEALCDIAPDKDRIVASSKINDNVMSVAYAMLTLHNICKENKEKGTPCEQCILSNKDGICGIVGKFPGEWKFTLEVLG